MVNFMKRKLNSTPSEVEFSQRRIKMRDDVGFVWQKSRRPNVAPELGTGWVQATNQEAIV